MKLCEFVDKEIVDMIIAGSVKGVSERERECIEQYKRGCSYSGQTYRKQVTYKFGKSVEEEEQGRWNAVGVSLQNMSRRLRSLLAGGLYADVDMVNAQPRLLLQLCERRGWECRELRNYVDNRDAVLAAVMEADGCDRDKAKETLNGVVYGQKAPPALEAFGKEMAATRKHVHNENRKLAAKLEQCGGERGDRNLRARVMAFALQTVERQCLEAMREALKKRGYEMHVLIHDGGLVRTYGDVKELPADVLREVEAHVHSETGYHIQLLCKPMETDIVLPPRPTEEYAKRKAEFERWHFKCHGEFAIFGDGDGKAAHKGWRFVDRHKFSDIYHHLRLSNGSSFIAKWMEDPDIRTYAAREFWPPGHAHEGDDLERTVFNMWPGFAAEKLPELTEEEKADEFIKEGVQRVLHHIEHVICSGNADAYRWILGFIACLLRRPGNKCGSPALVIAGGKGAGKDLFAEFLRLLVGWVLTYTTGDWKSVVGDFTMSTACKVLVWIQEGGMKHNSQLAEKAKNRITAEKVEFVAKCKDGVNLDDCTRIINTTNNFDAVSIGEDDRHYCMLKVADTYIGNKPYFEALVRSIRSPRVQRMLFDFFTTTDELLEGWNGRDYPRTELHRDVAVSTIAHEAFFAMHWLGGRSVEEGPTIEVKVCDLYQQYCGYCESKRRGAPLLSYQLFINGMKNAAWLEKALMGKRTVNHNSHTVWQINLPAWRAEFVRRGLMVRDETGEALPTELGIEIDDAARGGEAAGAARATGISAGCAGGPAIGGAGAAASAAVESDF